jgi:hypothetical protein
MSFDNPQTGPSDNPQGFGAPPPYPGQGDPSQGQGYPTQGYPGQGQPYPNQPYGQPPYPGQPGQGYGAPYGSPLPPGGKPTTYMAWAIAASVAGIFFSLILGFPAGMAARHYARKVSRTWAAGDVAESAKSSRRALTWSIIATVLDILGLILFITVLSHPAASTG